MKSDQVLVLDVGASKVTAVCARLEQKSGFLVEAISTVPARVLQKGVVVDPAAAAEAIRNAIDSVREQADCHLDELVVSVAGPHLEGMNAQGLKPIVPRGRLVTYQDVLEVINHSRAVVLPEGREQIQALPRLFKVDSNKDIHKPIGMPAGKLEVTTYIVSGSNAAIQALNDAVTAAGCHVEQMVFAPLAAGIGILTQDEMENGAVVVDIGAGLTNVGVFSNGSIAYGAALPVSSTSVTSDIRQLLKTSWEDADHLKLTHAVAHSKSVHPKETVEILQEGQDSPRPLQKRVLAEIVEARMREIALMVRSQIEISGLLEALPGGVVLTGGGAQLPGVDKTFQENLGSLKVRLAEPQLPGKLPHTVGSAVAVGLAGFALQCFDELTPPSGSTLWKDRVKSLFSMISR